MVNLVTLLQPAQNRDGFLHIGLVDQYRLESPLKGFVLFHVLSIFVQGGSPNTMKFPPGQHGLQDVAGIHGPLGSTSTDYGVKLVYEEDNLAFRFLNLLEHGLQPLLKLTPILGSCNQGPHIQANEAAVLETFGNVSPDHSESQSLHDGCLAHTGIPNEDRIVLGPSREDLDEPPNLVVPADDGVELALGGHLCKVTAVAFQGLIGPFRRLTRHPLMATNGFKDLHQIFPSGPGTGKDLAGGARTPLLDHGHEKVFYAHVLVFQMARLSFCPIQEPVQPLAHVHLASPCP